MPKLQLPKITVRDRPPVQSLADTTVLERWDAGIRAVASGDNVITVFETIGKDPWTGGGITAKSITAQLRAIGDRPVEVQINSPGGDMFEGIAIYNVLRDHPQDITVKVMGLAASAASVIAMAGDAIQIGLASFLMIHNAWVLAMGNRHDMQQVADFLAPFDAAMAEVYAARTGKPASDMAALMDKESWIGGQQAIDMGFADTLLSADEIASDPAASAAGRQQHEVRVMEQALLRTGLSRTEARAHIRKLKGMPDAALIGTLDAADPQDWSQMAASLIHTLKN